MVRTRHVRQQAKFDPDKLADEIATGLKIYRRGAPDRLLPIFDFFEGELELIVEALRGMAKPKKPAKTAG